MKKIWADDKGQRYLGVVRGAPRYVEFFCEYTDLDGRDYWAPAECTDAAILAAVMALPDLAEEVLPRVEEDADPFDDGLGPTGPLAGEFNPYACDEVPHPQNPFEGE